MAEPDYYEVLQVQPSADWEVIEAAYRRLARKYHPDVNRSPEAGQRMRELNAAYEVLCNPTLRRDYDTRRRSHGHFASPEPTPDSVFTGQPSTSPRQGLAATARFWLRWLAVLPGGILAAVLVSFPVHWAVLLITSGSNEDESLGLSDLPPETLERLAVAFFVPLTLVTVGAKVAPTYKLYSAALLALLYAMGLGAALTYAGTSGNYEGSLWLEFAGVGLLGFVGVASAVYYVYQEEGLQQG